MALYPYQERVKNYLLAGRSVVLQAPTGLGKTRAALSPYIEGFFDLAAEQFPRKCIYSVPMRVLANQFYAAYHAYAESYQRRFHKHVDVRIQTGDHAGDPQLRGDLIFATIDQSLSSALGVPYSLSPRSANLNAGAFCSSYLVFDEFHLFPSSGEEGIEGALVTTLQLLMNLKEIVPFVLMTATFSSTMLQRLGSLLGAEVVTVPPDEVAMIATAGGTKPARSRTYTVHDAPLCAKAILDVHQQRSIAICNQVQRAQELYQALCREAAGQEIEITLLHSRFTAEDRRRKEAAIRTQFAQHGQDGKSRILVATQVIEVGLDITCEHLHTEIAPANAILQRAGRCARYAGEQGHVHIYRVPTRSATESGTSDAPAAALYDYLPYPAALCEKSWQSFAARSGQVIDFQEEQRIIDEVHTEGDRQLLDAMARQTGRIWQEITTTLDSSDMSRRANLIRRIDNIKVLVADHPDDVGNPFTAEGFGLYRWSVVSLLRRLQAQQHESSPNELASPWIMKYPVVVDPNPDDPTSTPQIKWELVRDASLLQATPVVVINRIFCAYDESLGFRIVEPEQSTAWTSPPGPFATGNRTRGFCYKLESYTEHIAEMLQVYQDNFAGDYAYVQRRFAEKDLIPADGLERAIRLAIACHDLAKLDKRWQRWVHAYQNAIGEPLPSADYMAVHTHWDPDNPLHQQAKRIAARQGQRPHHAGESAVAASQVIAEVMRDSNGLGRAVCTAIARHHSPTTASFEDYELHPGAGEALRHALATAELVTTKPLIMERAGRSLEQLLIRPDFHQQVLYLLVVRMLRLCDGLSQDKRGK